MSIHQHIEQTMKMLQIPLIWNVRYNLLNQLYNRRWISFQYHLTEYAYVFMNRHVRVQIPEDPLNI